ncbi:MAG TPA: hypothetical protein VNA24_15565 [Hyalangium sp.]|jgi:hypothetical protein|nr:hypothetical protein [Hyalangium sp.]
MKTKLLVGAVAALLYGGVALAEDKDCPPGYDMKDSQASLDAQVGDESLDVIETEPVDETIGGAGQEGMDQDLTTDEQFNEGVGGSGNVGQGDMLLRCQPVRPNTGTGGSGAIDQNYGESQGSGSSDVGEGGSGFQSEPLREPQLTPPAEPVTPQVEPVPPPSGAFAPIEQEQEMKKESKANMRGLTVTVGGGVEGYTGGLAPEINPGPAYGVQAEIRPSKVLGLELGYSGAVNELDERVAPLGGTDGPDLVRNGGQAAVTVGLTAAPVQPYLLGGIGFSDYNFRGAGSSVGNFSDDTVGNVPVGVGLRTHIGSFTADLRANYNFLFDQDFSGVDSDFNENGRYSGTLNIGGTF